MNDFLLLRLRYLWAFYKSTLWVTLPFAILVGSIVYTEKWLEDAIKNPCTSILYGVCCWMR